MYQGASPWGQHIWWVDNNCNIPHHDCGPSDVHHTSGESTTTTTSHTMTVALVMSMRTAHLVSRQQPQHPTPWTVALVMSMRKSYSWWVDNNHNNNSPHHNSGPNSSPSGKSTTTTTFLTKMVAPVMSMSTAKLVRWLHLQMVWVLLLRNARQPSLDQALKM